MHPPQPSESTGDTVSSLGLESLWKICGGAASVADLPDPLIGARLGGVVLLRMIAEGGMGRVYEGRQDTPARTVAVKVLRPGMSSVEALRRFANEAEILGRLRHPAIAHIYAAGMFAVLDAHVPYIVMEYVPSAVPITRYVREKRMSLDQRLDLFAAVIDAVAHGHSRGVIHRDLKPGNILVDAEGRPKVIDFGVAREMGRDGDAMLTRFGQVLGTLQFMSPEQVNAEAERVNASSDVYSLGVVLHEVLTDQPPYDLRDRTLVEAARIIQERKPPAARLIRRQIPRGVSDLIEKCLAKDAAARFASAGELMTAYAEARTAAPVPRRAMVAAMAAAAVAATGAAAACVRSLLRPSPIAPPPVGQAGDAVTAGTVEHAFTSIEDADPFLVEKTGVRIYREWQQPPDVYWGPEANGREGRLLYRFPFPGTTRAVRLFAAAPCWDFFTEPGGIGRGAAAIEVSNDGSDWHAICNGIEPRAWGTDCSIDDQIPAAACGTATVFVRVRLLVEGCPNVAYTTAQFGRGSAAARDTVFAVTATELHGGPPRRP